MASTRILETIPNEVELEDPAENIDKDVTDPYIRRDLAYRSVVDRAFKMFQQKNRQYEDGIRFTGVLGACVEIFGAAMRLPPMVLRSADHGKSNMNKLRGILGDIVNYGVIAIIMMEDDNWEGKY